MAGVDDIEALLDSTAKDSDVQTSNRPSRADAAPRDHGTHRDDRRRESSRDRERRRRDQSRERRNRERERYGRGDVNPRRGGGRHAERYRPPRHFGDHYDGGGRSRQRSRSPNDDRHYRPSGHREHREPRGTSPRDRSSPPRERVSSPRDRAAPPRERVSSPRDRAAPAGEPEEYIALEPEPNGRTPRTHAVSNRENDDRENGGRESGGRDRRRGRRNDRQRSRSPRRAPNSEAKDEPQPTEDERDRRTVFVQQLAARLHHYQLIEFFKDAGTVKDAQIVKDRISGRSKGVGYVEFKEEAAVQKAIGYTGKTLLKIPIIVARTEAEKNRQAKANANAEGNANPVPAHSVYVGNIHFSVTEDDLKTVFGNLGELEKLELFKDAEGRSKGSAFVLYREPAVAKEAIERLNGLQLAGRPIRVGLGSDKQGGESSKTFAQAYGPPASYQGSSFSGAGGRGTHAGGSGHFDRVGGREDKQQGGASALDDTDVGGVKLNRESLMKKLMRDEDPEEVARREQAEARARAAEPVQRLQASRCVKLGNCFDPKLEDEPNWPMELKEEIRDECQKSYGRVVHIFVDQNSDDGEVWVAFDKLEGGDAALKGLNGRYFAGRTISAAPVVEAAYRSQFPRAMG